MTKDTLLELAERVEAGHGPDNSLDVEIEVATFRPTGTSMTCRANAAGTKVIYGDRDGKETTHWAPDWTAHRGDAAELIRAHIDHVAAVEARAALSPHARAAGE